MKVNWYFNITSITALAWEAIGLEAKWFEVETENGVAVVRFSTGEVWNLRYHLHGF